MNINNTSGIAPAASDYTVSHGTMPENVKQHDEQAQNTASPVQKNDEELFSSKEEMKQTVEAINDYMDELQTNLGFSIHDKTDQIIVTITNRETEEVIKQIPAKELVTIREKMEELTGILFSKTA